MNDVTLRMPRCEGRPNEACPSRRNDNTVQLSQGDLMLCEECDRCRFPPQPLPSVRSRHNKASEKASASVSNIKTTGSASRVADNTPACPSDATQNPVPTTPTSATDNVQKQVTIISCLSKV